jgi:cation transport ATPase
MRNIAHTIKPSRGTHVVAWRNIAPALGIKGVFTVLRMLGRASMGIAIFAEMDASLLVGFNRLRPLQ